MVAISAVCVSKTVRDYLLGNYPQVDPAKLVVIPRGIDPARFPRSPWPDRDARAQVAARLPRLGGDGPLQHWGIGRWHGAAATGVLSGP